MNEEVKNLFTKIKAGEYLMEEGLGTLLDALDKQFQLERPVIETINSLLNRIGKIIIPIYDRLLSRKEEERCTVTNITKSLANEAVKVILEIGNRGAMQYSEVKEADQNTTMVKIRGMAREITFKLVKLMAGFYVNERDETTALLFTGHPLIMPLISWLSYGFNRQDKTVEDEKALFNFLERIGRLLLCNKTKDILLSNGPEFKNDLAAIFAATLYRPEHAFIARQIAEAEFIDVIPVLADRIWRGGIKNDKEKEYEKLLTLVKQPQSSTTIGDLLEILPLPFDCDLCHIHFTLLCELWPKWKKAKATE